MPGRRIALTLLLRAHGRDAGGQRSSTAPDLRADLRRNPGRPGRGQQIDVTNVKWAFPAVLFVDIWMWTPFMILMTLAALGSCRPHDWSSGEPAFLLAEAALRSSLPHGKFILMLGILLRTIDAYKTTDLVFVMTNGGPGNVTELIGLKLYRFAFASLNIGFSSALALVLLLIAIAFTSIFLYVLYLRRTVEA
ncbi:MAG: hypothetical protein R3A10_09935 [Caldilineaceae bacterium]